MTPAGWGVRIWGIVPAAGMSRRMGRAKQSLTYRDSTIAGTVARTLLDAGLEGVVVVTRGELIGALDLPDDPRVATAVNDDADSEMIDSIRIGFAAITGGRASADGVLVVPADMPTLTVNACRACIAVFADSPGSIVTAKHAGERRHPIIFPFLMRGTLDRLEDGLRELLRALPDRVKPPRPP